MSWIWLNSVGRYLWQDPWGFLTCLKVFLILPYVSEVLVKYLECGPMMRDNCKRIRKGGWHVQKYFIVSCFHLPEYSFPPKFCWIFCVIYKFLTWIFDPLDLGVVCSLCLERSKCITSKPLLKLIPSFPCCLMCTIILNAVYTIFIHRERS